MVKFSVEGGRRDKRRRLHTACPFPAPSHSEDEEDEEGEEEQGQEGGQHNGEEEQGGGGVAGESSRTVEGSNRCKETITVSIDPDILDCCICFEPLSPPVFQCRNGHIACSSCCNKIKNECYSCPDSIGSIRCLAVEKVIESLQVSCSYADNGCKETISYRQRHAHEEMCIYSPCSCPISDCTFEGFCQQLPLHMISRHNMRASSFKYNSFFSVCLKKYTPYYMLCGEDGTLFLLSNDASNSLGNVVMLTCTKPKSLKEEFSYELTARREGCSSSSIHLEAPMTYIKEKSSKDYLLIPQGFFPVSTRSPILEIFSTPKLSMEVCVRSKVA